MTISIYPLALSEVPVGGVAVTAAYGPIVGGIILNPLQASDEGIPDDEILFVDITGPAFLGETETTFALLPGATYTIPSGLTANVSVNAATSGHRFSGIVFQPPTPFPPVPQPSTFPPDGPTTLTQTIPSYLYQQYADDDDLQAFITSYNSLVQGYVNWFATALLPVYTSPAVFGALLDWVAEGLYGMERPSLSSGLNRTKGPLNTYAYNTLPLNRRKLVGPTDVTVTSDDVFKRIMTWNFYKGDGNVFSIKWLKRRILRFLTGENGTAPNIDSTYNISVTTGPGVISIKVNAGTRTITGGALYNRTGFNRVAYNSLQTIFHPDPSAQYPLQSVLKEALDSGVLQVPFQYTVTIVS